MPGLIRFSEKTSETIYVKNLCPGKYKDIKRRGTLLFSFFERKEEKKRREEERENYHRITKRSFQFFLAIPSSCVYFVNALLVRSYN